MSAIELPNPRRRNLKLAVCTGLSGAGVLSLARRAENIEEAVRVHIEMCIEEFAIENPQLKTKLNELYDFIVEGR